MAVRLKASARTSLEDEMAFALKAAGLPEPVRELHFDWCCEHDAVVHWYVERKRRLCRHCPEDQAHHLLRRGRAWRFDFAWPHRKVALEIEGAVHSGGRHTRGVGFTKDAEKYNHAQLLGWTVYRVTGAMVKSGEALTVIQQALGVKS